MQFFHPGEDVQHASNQLRIVGSPPWRRKEGNHVDIPLETLGEADGLRHQSLGVSHPAFLQQVRHRANYNDTTLRYSIALQAIQEVGSNLKQEAPFNSQNDWTFPILRRENGGILWSQRKISCLPSSHLFLSRCLGRSWCFFSQLTHVQSSGWKLLVDTVVLHHHSNVVPVVSVEKDITTCERVCRRSRSNSVCSPRSFSCV